MSEIILAVIECSTNMSYIWCIYAQSILFQPPLGAVLTVTYVALSCGFCHLHQQTTPWVDFKLDSL